MNRITEELWPADEPTHHFAEATVERMLANPELPRIRNTQHYRLAWLLLAAFFVTGVALGVAMRNREKAVQPAAQSVAPSRVGFEAPKVESHWQGAPAPIKLPNAKKTSVVAPIVSPSAVHSATAPSPVPSPKVPPCGCERGFGDYICDCY